MCSRLTKCVCICVSRTSMYNFYVVMFHSSFPLSRRWGIFTFLLCSHNPVGFFCLFVCLHGTAWTQKKWSFQIIACGSSLNTFPICVQKWDQNSYSFLPVYMLISLSIQYCHLWQNINWEVDLFQLKLSYLIDGGSFLINSRCKIKVTNRICKSQSKLLLLQSDWLIHTKLNFVFIIYVSIYLLT